MINFLHNFGEIILIISIIALTVVVVWTLMRFSVMILNIKAINKSKQSPDFRNRKQGMVVNKKTHRLEADQSFVTPL